jgi:hypothetical protein
MADAARFRRRHAMFVLLIPRCYYGSAPAAATRAQRTPVSEKRAAQRAIAARRAQNTSNFSSFFRLFFFFPLHAEIIKML